MYNYFIIIGSIESITPDSIVIFSNKEHLEVLIKTSKYPELEVNHMVSVAGSFKAKGLVANKLYILNISTGNKIIKVDEEEEPTQEAPVVEEAPIVEETPVVEEPITEPVEEVQEPQEISTADEIDGHINGSDEPSNNYPEDFQPLYNVNEEFTIKYDYDRVVEHLHILEIIPILKDKTIVDYNYRCLLINVDGSEMFHKNHGVRIYSENFLADNEVNEG